MKGKFDAALTVIWRKGKNQKEQLKGCGHFHLKIIMPWTKFVTVGLKRKNSKDVGSQIEYLGIWLMIIVVKEKQRMSMIRGFFALMGK